MSDWLTPEERKIWAALTVRSNEPGAMALLDKVDALVRKLQERAAHISNQEATELQDILRTLVPSGVALITNARELRDEWDKEKKRAQGWRCFHCGEFFQTSEAAKNHFGDGSFEDEPPACIRILTEGEKAVMDENRAMFSDLQATRRENEALESKLGAVYSDLSARFKGAKDVGTAWNMYDSMEGRAIAAEERAEELAPKCAISIGAAKNAMKLIEPAFMDTGAYRLLQAATEEMPAAVKDFVMIWETIPEIRKILYGTMLADGSREAWARARFIECAERIMKCEEKPING